MRAEVVRMLHVNAIELRAPVCHCWFLSFKAVRASQLSRPNNAGSHLLPLTIQRKSSLASSSFST
jgi:hypothetical protein